MKLSSVVCLCILSVIAFLAIGYAGLLVFWSADVAGLSARDNTEALLARARSATSSAIAAVELIESTGMSPTACLCIATPYSFAEDALIVGQNDVSDDLGSESINDGIVALYAVDPERDGDVDRAVVHRAGLDFSLPASAFAKGHSGIWCTPSTALIETRAEGGRMILTIKDVNLLDSSCAIRGGAEFSNP